MYFTKLLCCYLLCVYIYVCMCSFISIFIYQYVSIHYIMYKFIYHEAIHIYIYLNIYLWLGDDFGPPLLRHLHVTTTYILSLLTSTSDIWQ